AASGVESSSSTRTSNFEKDKECLTPDLDGSTLDGHQDVESAVNNDSDIDRPQEARDFDHDDDDDVNAIVLPHDFHGLFEALYCAENNLSLRIPEEPRMESALKTSLFQYVKDRLIGYNDLPRIIQKDLFVAVSSVAHLHCADAKTIFKFNDMPRLLEKAKEPEMAVPSTSLLDLLTALKGQALDDLGNFSAEELVNLINIKKGSLATELRAGQKIDVSVRIAIDILQIVAPLCIADPIRRPVDTEQKSQAVWERVFNILFERTAVTTVIGETGLGGSGEARTQNETDYAVQELKEDTKGKKRAAPREIEVMIRKNIRHNHLIISQIGMPKMYFLNTHAYSATLMSLLEYEDVHICGNVLDHDLVIPTNVLELELFMDGQVLEVLLSLRIGRQLALQRLKSVSGSAAPTSTHHNVRTFYTPMKDKSSPKKQPPCSPRKRPTGNSSSTSSQKRR
ncbi:hypothetical protein BGZ83_002663, partial [Gryganskiella cystojenkinii]